MKNYPTRLTLMLFLTGAIFGGVVQAKEIANTVVKQEANESFQELSREDFQPAFTKNTVIKLNGIVSRSLDVINEYDSIMTDVRRVEQAPVADQDLSNQLKQIQQLSSQSKKVLSEMLLAEETLKESDEIFNSAILAGMVDFVSDVEREVSAQSEKLTQSLTKN